jgi:hypothetical protein
MIIDYDVCLKYIIKNHKDTNSFDESNKPNLNNREIVNIIDASESEYIAQIINNYYTQQSLLPPLLTTSTPTFHTQLPPTILLTNVSEENNNTDSDESICTSDIEGDDSDNDSNKQMHIFDTDDDFELTDEMKDMFWNRFGSTIKIPNKLNLIIRDYCELSKIDKDRTVAFEKCLLFLSLLKIYNFENNTYSNEYTMIASTRLRKLFGDDYKVMIDVLMKGTANGSIIECDELYIIGTDYSDAKCLGYRLSDRYRGKGYSTYTLKTNKAKEIYLKSMYKRIAKMFTNPICKKIVSTYADITLPTKQEIISRGKELIKKKYITNKGSYLVSRGRQTKEQRLPQLIKKYSNCVEDASTLKFSFIEDAIEIFSYLTDGGFVVPIVGDYKSGGRVVDAFTLMPSWIRSMVLMDDLEMESFDYTALHPNICLKQYGSPIEAEKLSGDVHTNLLEKYPTESKEEAIERRKRIKRENLSFFNKQIADMRKSILYDMYEDNAPVMLKNIIAEKMKYNHKKTSQTLFTIEVNIMTEVIRRLPDDVGCVYVYDALYSTMNNSEIIIETMNAVAKEYGIGTYVKMN